MDTYKIKLDLISRRQRLSDLYKEVKAARRPVELDQTRVGRLSRMDSLQLDAMAEETARRRNAEIVQIDAALTRIENDEYGLCAKCGQKIGAKRLQLQPMVAFCLDCAANK